MRLLPPIVTGPVIIVIGLVLAPVGVNMALGKAGDGSAVLVPENTALIISMAALATTVLVSLLGRGMIRLIPIMSGIAVGYLCAIGLGIHDFSKVAAAPRLPAGSSQPKASPGTKNSISTTPKAAPELMPSTSGLAIGLPVRR